MKENRHFERSKPTPLLFRFIRMNRSVCEERNLSSRQAKHQSHKYLRDLCAPVSVHSVFIFSLCFSELTTDD